MQIPTDFVPTPGDRIRRRQPSGGIRTLVWVLCPDCSEGRWVPIGTLNRPSFTGCCKRCILVRLKRGGWPCLGYYVEVGGGNRKGR